MEMSWNPAGEGTGHQEASPMSRDVDDNALTREFGVCLLNSPSISVAADSMDWGGGCPRPPPPTPGSGCPRVLCCQLAQSWDEQALVAAPERNTGCGLVAQQSTGSWSHATLFLIQNVTLQLPPWISSLLRFIVPRAERPVPASWINIDLSSRWPQGPEAAVSTPL